MSKQFAIGLGAGAIGMLLQVKIDGLWLGFILSALVILIAIFWADREESKS